jgi:branched-subunit amino acid ABC-type transport system permease component
LTGRVLLHRVQAVYGHHDGAMLGMPGHRDAHGTLLMLAAHALAAVAVALLLHGADRRLSALPSVLVLSLAAVVARLLTWCLFRPAHGAGPYGPRAPQTRPVAGLGTALLAHSVVRRGPPVWQGPI